MAKGYPAEFCDEVVAFVEAGNSRRAAAQHFGVSASFVVKLMKREPVTLSVQAEPVAPVVKQAVIEPFSSDTEVSAKDLANLFGLSERSISNLTNNGIVHRIGRNRYHLARSVQLYCESLKELAVRKAASETNDEAREKARYVKEQADREALKNAATRRELISVNDVQREWGEIARKIRNGLLAVPSRVRQTLGHLTSYDVDLIDREIRSVLTGLGHDSIGHDRTVAIGSLDGVDATAEAEAVGVD